MLLFRGGAVVKRNFTTEDRKAQVQKWRTWTLELQTGGHHVPAGFPLDTTGKLLSGSERTVTDGPYGGGNDLLTGNFVLEAASLEAATDLAKGCPILDVDGTVEVRPKLDRPA